MKKLIVILLAGILVFAISCGGGGTGSTSNADRFVGDWTGQMVQTFRDDGEPLQTIALRLYNEYAGKDEFVEYISCSIFFDGVLVANGVTEAIPGGVWQVHIPDSEGTVFSMGGQFIGDTATGSFSIVGDNPDPPPFGEITISGTWSASR